MKALPILKTDLKNIFRDPSIMIIFIAPVAITVLLRIAPPLYESHFPVMFQYRPLILGVFCVLISVLIGFLIAFVMLDEKDQQLFEVFKVTPFSFSKLIRYRISIMIITGFIFSFLLIYISELVPMEPFQMILLALLCSLAGPVNTLLIVSLAHNKIEGATYFKLFNMIIIAPAAAVFIASPLKYITGLIPFFWMYDAFISLDESGNFYWIVGIGMAINGAYLVLSYRFFLNRSDR